MLRVSALLALRNGADHYGIVLAFSACCLLEGRELALLRTSHL
jgi:hypothetical protein